MKVKCTRLYRPNTFTNKDNKNKENGLNTNPKENY